MTNERAVNTVIDVAFALLFVGVAITLLSGLLTTSEAEHDPLDADRTAGVVSSSTLNVTYSLEPAVDTAKPELDRTPEDSMSRKDLIRISHGSIADQTGKVALENLTIRTAGPNRLTATRASHQRALDERVQSRLVGSQFETSVTAEWKPYDAAPIWGTATVGADPPPNKAISSAVISIPSGVEPVRDEAIAVANEGGDYDEIAQLVAVAVIENYLPELESKRALERSGVGRTLTLYRYQRMATILDEASFDSETMDDALGQNRADPTTANSYLSSKLASQISADLQSRFDSPTEAARSISTDEVTVTVRTWEP